MSNPFTLLMSVYQYTQHMDLDACLWSVAEQGKRPMEIVIVLDGPTSEEVDKTLEKWCSRLPVRLLCFPQNRGLGAALQDGLSVASHDLVARMDSDDICTVDRFGRQLAYLEKNLGISVLGGLMAESYDKHKEGGSYVRNVPLTPEEIVRYARYRNPLNHPTVMFRKQDVLAAGGYRAMPAFEDYYLWVRMLKQNFRIANLDQVLVESKSDSGFVQRRGGWSYLKKEFFLSMEFRRLGYHSLQDTIRFLAIRTPYRLMPREARTWAYRNTLRKRLI